MSNQLCKCGDGLSNTGFPNCIKTPRVIKKAIFVQLTANDGTLNKVDPATMTSLSAYTALINNADKSKRWFPTPELKNITTPKDDPIYEKFDDDSSVFIRESIRKFTALLPNAPAQFKDRFESIRCVNNTGVYFVDVEGNLVGLTNGSDDYLYPFPVNAQSAYGKYELATDKTSTQMTLMFEFPSTVRDGLIRLIAATTFTDFTMVSLSGLQDVTGKVSSPSTTGFTLKLNVESAEVGNPVPVQGLIASNFVLAKKSPTPGAITITSVTETVPGTYVFVIPTQTSGDQLKVTPTLAGFDFSTVPALAITIP
jgi:hypothetical protein